MRKLFAILVLGLFCSNNIYASDTYIAIGTGGSTGVYFQVGNAMCKMVAKIQSQAHGRKKGTEKSYRCSAPSTGGSNFNIGKISEGNLQFGLAQSDWHGHAYNGTSKWRGKQFGNLRAVFSVHNEPFQIMVKKRKIKSFDDLRGKIVNIGNPGSGQRGFMEELLNAQGISTSFFKRATELTSSEMYKAFCDNKIDAFGYTVGFPNRGMEWAARCGGTLINLNSTAIQRLVANNPAYAFATIPRGTYSGQKRDIQTYGVKATVVTSVDVPEETVYDVVKAVFDNLDDFKRQHPAFAYLNKNMMLDGLSAPLHNGALKYFNESGASIAQKPDTKTPRTEPNNKKPKTVAKKPEAIKPFAKSKLINEIKNAPNESSRNRIIYYFFAYTSSNDLYYGWAYPITMPNGKIKEFYGVANSVNYKTGKYNKNCNITSKQTKTSAPFQGNFNMECPNDKKQNIVGAWTQDQFDEPGLGSGFNKNGDQVSVFFALQKEILINSINSFNFDGVQEVKKPSPKKVVKKSPPKKQIIKSPEIDGSLLTIGSGSGFYINNKGYALTNNHVVAICKQMVAIVDGREILFRVLNTDKTNDVAVIKTDQRSPNFIRINEEGAELGEDIIAVGYPLSGRLSDSVKITRGIVSALSGMNNNSGQIQIDAALQPGNSGGPVINENGELIGIASAGLNKLLMAKEAKYIPENVNFAVSSSIVTNILKNKKVNYSTPSFFSGSYSNTELAKLGDKVTLQLFCRNTRTAYNKLKQSKKYSHILIDLD